VGIPFFFLPLRMRRNHNDLACQDTYEDILLQAIRGSRPDAANRSATAA